MGDYYYYGQRFYSRQLLAVKGHDLPGYLIKWADTRFTFFDTREEVMGWFQRARAQCLSTEPRQCFMPLEVVYQGQRCGFYADIECITPETMSTEQENTLKADIVRYVNTAYDARGLDSGALLWSENHRGPKISFHVVGRDVDFEGTSPIGPGTGGLQDEQGLHRINERISLRELLGVQEG